MTAIRRVTGPIRLLSQRLLHLPRARILAAPVLAAVAVATGAPVAAPRPPLQVLRDPPAARLPLRTLDQMEAAVPLSLPAATAPPVAAPPELSQAPLAPDEVFGFAPYWTLDLAAGFAVGRLSTVAYFGVDVSGDGSLLHSGNGWVGYQSQQLADLVTRAHAAGDRVTLTAKTFDSDALHRLANDTGASAVLVQQLADAIRAKNMDGANLDFEGTGNSDRAAFASFIRRVADGLHAQNPHWQVTVDTYASSASDAAGWFDVAAMQPSVDAFFVMAYDMYEPGVASPNAPLTGYHANDQGAVASYVAVVPRQKVLLGVPFYGYDWVTADNQPNRQSPSPPTPVSYSEVAAGGHQTYWDSNGNVPWTAYQQSGKWHEVYYDDPTSVAMKARLASDSHILGVGIWALGMDGNDPALMAALVGNQRLVKPGPEGPGGPSASPSAPAPGGQGSGGSAPPPARPSPSPSPKPSPSPSPSPLIQPGGGGLPLPSPTPLPLP
ncbi:MAG TPA: glycosyl hydrolase family 18 protein [Candidatus Solibacter sp.]|jgi:spore germination protein|nr:glycosyl hydrolase family 18 protein [Candidatus Solibacter sp.]